MLKAEVSIPIGLATVAMAYGIFQMELPSVTDVRVSPRGDSHIAGSERNATWIAAGMVAGVSLLAKDPTIFTIGGISVIAFAWTYRHANHVDPATGKASAAMNARVGIPGVLPTGANYSTQPSVDDTSSADDGSSSYAVEGY